MKYIIGILIVTLSACSFYTDISYRADKKEEYIREDGYIISCQRSGNGLLIGTYTPYTWGEGFYYDWLKGNKSDKKIKIISVNVLFLDTNDTLTLKEVRKEREYFFTSSGLKTIINNNKRLKVIISFIDMSSGKNEMKEFVLTRKKHTYPTGTFPHS
ncbi:hypothetical protein [Cytophaga aurantiaca]|uniref:hypothetical protein n=1 Tax=Cytophaga aurantiaca TaxID=29530 RepID=UPI00037CA6F5|nr:hypothetical protein [Cytophaga aurantiaca]